MKYFIFTSVGILAIALLVSAAEYETLVKDKEFISAETSSGVWCDHRGPVHHTGRDIVCECGAVVGVDYGG